MPAYLENTVFSVILLMALVTYLPRLLPILFLSRRKLPPRVRIWLAYIPVAVLASLLGPALLTAEGQLTLHPLANPYFWAAIPSLAVALLTKNMFLTILAGMIGVALLRLLF